MEPHVRADGHFNIGKLISFISRSNNCYIAHRLEPLGIGSGQHPYLMTLYRSDGINQDELSRTVGVDKTTTTRAIGKLVLLGYIVRERDPSDGRAHLIFLTDKGRKIEPVVRGVLGELVSEISKGLTTEELEELHELLLKVACNSSRITGHEISLAPCGGK